MIQHSRKGIGEKALLRSGSARKLLPLKGVYHKGYHEGCHEGCHKGYYES